MNLPILRFRAFNDTWEETSFRGIGHFYYGKSAPKWSVEKDAKTPCVRYGELYTKFDGIVDRIYSYTNISPNELKFSKGGEVLIPRVGEDPLDFSKASYLPIPNIAIGEMISVFNTKQYGLFLVHYIRAKLKKSFARLVEGGNVSNLYFSYLEDVAINIPTIEEQTKIANFLTAVDEKISQLTQKCELLAQYKKGVMQKIFSQELRFRDDDGQEFPEWDEQSLDELLDYEQPTKYLVSSTEYSDNYPTPVLTAGKTFILGYSNETTGICEDGLPVIIFDDFTTAFKYVTFPFKAKSSAMKILRIKNGSKNSIKYIYEAMQLIDFPSGDEHKRYWISEYSKQPIPVPSAKEQIKIANFLSAIDDKITHTQAQLKAAKQYKQGLLQQMFV